MSFGEPIPPLMQERNPDLTEEAALTMLNHIFGAIQHEDEIEAIGARLDDHQAKRIESAIEHVAKLAGDRLTDSGKLLQQISNPIFRQFFFNAAVRQLFFSVHAPHPVEQMQRVMTDAGFSSDLIEKETKTLETWLVRQGAASLPRTRNLVPFETEHLERIQTEHSKNEVFGENVLKALQSLREKLAQLDPSGQTEREVMASQIQELQQRLRDKVGTARVLLEFTYGKTLPLKESERLMDFLLADSPHIDDLPQEELEKMIEEHVYAFKERQRFFLEEEVPQLLADFKQNVEDALDQTELPLTQENFLHRLQGLQIHLGDSLEILTDPSRTIGLQGAYLLRSHTILIGDLTSDKKHFFFHEITHATISGRKVSINRYNGAGPSKLGLTFDKGHRKYYEWFNEAKTEEIALRLLGRADSTVYPEERQELQQLYDAGVPRALTDAVFCEDFNPNDPLPERMKHWRALMKKMNEIFPEGGARRLHNVEQQLMTTVDSKAA